MRILTRRGFQFCCFECFVHSGSWSKVCGILRLNLLVFLFAYIYAFYLDNSFSVWLCWFICFFSSPPQWPMTSDFEGFLSRFYPLHFCPIVILEKGQYFAFECWVLNSTIFIMSLVWRGPWLGLYLGPPALEASTLPLGYRGGGLSISLNNTITFVL